MDGLVLVVSEDKGLENHALVPVQKRKHHIKMYERLRLGRKLLYDDMEDTSVMFPAEPLHHEIDSLGACTASVSKDKDIIVIPTKTVPQGITAMINYMPDSSVEENEARMTEEIGNVKTGQVTYAVRDTHIDDKDIKEGDIMGIGDHAILSVGKDVMETTLAMFDELVDEDSELISIYYGADVSKEDAASLGTSLGEKYPDCDIEVHFGGQPIYYYVASVE